MQLAIHGERIISDIQREFAIAYPFLKIEFFKNGSSLRKIHSVEKQLPQHLKLKDACRLKKSEGELEIGDFITVAELEKEFFDQFGLAVEVFRKSGNIWLETTMTDNWTLKQQNEHGQEITLGKKLPIGYSAKEDYELNRDADH